VESANAISAYAPNEKIEEGWEELEAEPEVAENGDVMKKTEVVETAEIEKKEAEEVKSQMSIDNLVNDPEPPVNALQKD
jgi:hypothetical protein